MSKLETLLLSGKTVFTVADLSVLWQQKKYSDTVQSAYQYAKAGKLYRLKHGLYSTIENPDPYLLANKAITPSYITGFTVIIRNGLSFQVSDTIHSAALYTKSLEIGNRIFQYHKINPRILENRLGIIEQDGLLIATTERAIADSLYWGMSTGVDLWHDVDIEKLTEIGQIYGKKSVLRNIERIRGELWTSKSIAMS